MRLLRHDLHSLSGAYALDALEGGVEHDRFTRHVSRCQSCAGEVRGFREVATALAFAAATEPPPELRDRVLAAAARTRRSARGQDPRAAAADAGLGALGAVAIRGHRDRLDRRRGAFRLRAVPHPAGTQPGPGREPGDLAASVLAASNAAQPLHHQGRRGHGSAGRGQASASRDHRRAARAAARQGVPALADRQDEDRVRGPAAASQFRADRAGAGVRGGQGRHARPDRRGLPRDRLSPPPSPSWPCRSPYRTWHQVRSGSASRSC